MPCLPGSITGPGPNVGLARYQVRAWLAEVNHRWSRPNAAARRVANALVALIGQGRRLYPTHATIARLAGCDERTSQRWIRAFVRAGLARVTHRRTEEGDQTSNAYELVAPDVPAPPPEPAELSSHRESTSRVASLPDSFGPVITASEARVRRAWLARPLRWGIRPR